MKLIELRLAGPHSYDNWTGYRGEVTFEGPLGKIQVQVHETLSQRILVACAEELAATAREVAEHMTAQIIEQASVPAIERSRPGPVPAEE